MKRDLALAPSFLDIHEGRAPHPPVAVLLGWHTLEFDSENGYIRGEMLAREEFLNPAGVLQGGMMCAMLDNAAGLAVMCTLGPGQMAPTLEIKSNFMRPGKPGKFIGEGWIRSQAAGVCFVEARLTTEAGQLVATASATARILAR
ncbi:PaaI family thioesterase [Variovorax beijingensis]|uniref:PaaI family thioesterase n=1 Tax=Variovorax beijingensis TaxID=2496117 RepID=A0A3P3E567_9BURK|nr:PaaI family thioesterase [Variovorax beijingensis]RRH80208.1 PaaI family thioesterase [Variovorax beijingensis]